jgi:hypothetical protein
LYSISSASPIKIISLVYGRCAQNPEEVKRIWKDDYNIQIAPDNGKTYIENHMQGHAMKKVNFFQVPVLEQR